jgi:DivIVA domain-containing protein
MAGEESPKPAQRDIGGSSASTDESGSLTQHRPVASEIGDVSFPGSVRGYDRAAVDAYVSRVQNLVAELEVTRSPESAVKHALEQVGEQTKGVLEQAGETAEQITAAAREKADDSIARANQEAERVGAAAKSEAADILGRSQAEAETTLAQARKEAAEHLRNVRAEAAAVRDEAEARRRELQADTETIRRERSHLLDDLRQLAVRVAEVASAADARFPSQEVPDRAAEESLQAETAGEGAATEQTATEKPTVEAGNPATPQQVK